MAVNAAELLAQLRSTTGEIIQTVESRYLDLKPKDLNWKPGPQRWSIAECLEHLNLYGDFYHDVFAEAIQRGLQQGLAPQPTYQPGWLGNYFAQSMLPRDGKVANKMATFKDKDPAQSHLPPGVIPRFLEQQARLLRLLEEAQQVDLGRVRIPISISTWIKLKLGDGLRFVINHNQRHLQQAQDVYAEIVFD